MVFGRRQEIVQRIQHHSVVISRLCDVSVDCVIFGGRRPAENMSDQLITSFGYQKSPGEEEIYDDNGLPPEVNLNKDLSTGQTDQEVTVESLAVEPKGDIERSDTGADGIWKNGRRISIDDKGSAKTLVCSLDSGGLPDAEDTITQRNYEDDDPGGIEREFAELNFSTVVGETNDKDAKNDREIIDKVVPAEEKCNDDFPVVGSIELNRNIDEPPKGPDKVVERQTAIVRQGHNATVGCFADGEVLEPEQECKDGVTFAEIRYETTVPKMKGNGTFDDHGSPPLFHAALECLKTDTDKSLIKDESAKVTSEKHFGQLLEGANRESREEVHCEDGRNPDCNTSQSGGEGREVKISKSYESVEELLNYVKSNECMDGGKAKDPEPFINERLYTSGAPEKGLHFSLNLPPVTLIVMFFIVGPAQGILTVIPMNTIAMAGTTVHLNCSTNLNEAVYWDRISFGTNENHLISFGSEGIAEFLDDRFSVFNDLQSGKYDLIIKDVQPKDAGIYICIDESGVGLSARADLVIAENFMCDMPVPPDGFMGENIFDIPENIVTSSCSLRFHGNTVPRLHWSWTVAPSLGHSSFESKTRSTVVSRLTLPATKDLNGAVLRCSVSLSDEAANPSTGLHWKSHPIVVKYVKFEAFVVNSCPGVDWCPVCNPECNYQWERTTDSSSCRCVSIYTDTKGITYNITINNLACEPSDTPAVVLTWQIVVIISVALLILIAVTIFFFLRQRGLDKCKKDAEKNPGAPHIYNDHKTSKGLKTEIISFIGFQH